ncbi:MAG: hypothetical protein WBD37_07930 [Anderseniella sp.]
MMDALVKKAGLLISRLRVSEPYDVLFGVNSCALCAFKLGIRAIANPVETAAFVSVGRACGFAGLGVLCFVLGLSFEPVLAAKTGCLLTLAICLFLLSRAWWVHRQPYKKTETWLILSQGDRPRAEVAQQLVSTALRQAYLYFAQKASFIALMFAAFAVVFQLGLIA